FGNSPAAAAGSCRNAKPMARMKMTRTTLRTEWSRTGTAQSPLTSRPSLGPAEKRLFLPLRGLCYRSYPLETRKFVKLNNLGRMDRTLSDPGSVWRLPHVVQSNFLLHCAKQSAAAFS